MKVWIKATMAEMIHWKLKRDLQIPFWGVNVRCMAQLFLVRSHGGYHHALPLFGHRRLLKNSLMNQILRLPTTLVSELSSLFAQSLQKETKFT